MKEGKNTQLLRWAAMILLLLTCLFLAGCDHPSDTPSLADLYALKWYWKFLLALVCVLAALLSIWATPLMVAQKNWDALVSMLFFLPMAIYIGYHLIYSLVQDGGSPVGLSALKGLLHTCGATALATTFSQLVFNLMNGDGGYATASGHEWRYLNRRGQPGGRYGSATVKDVYEHRHGYGSWKSHQQSQQNFVAFLRVVAVTVSIYVPFFLRSKGVITTGGISNFVLVMVAGLVSILLALTVTIMDWGWIIGLIICALLGGLVWWSGGLTAG